MVCLIYLDQRRQCEGNLDHSPQASEDFFPNDRVLMHSLLWEKKWKELKVLVAPSCLTLCDPMDCSPPGSSVHGDSPGKNTGVGCHALLQGIFPTQEPNPGLLHCRQILYHLSQLGTPKKGMAIKYSCLEHPMDRGAWRVIVYWVSKSPTWLNN